MQELLVVKIGGNIIDDEKQLDNFLSDFAAITKPKILVHGGGKLATQLSEQLGIKTNMVNGRRITDMETLRIVTMTYAGWVNKTIVAKLQSLQCNAIGLSGADAQLIPAVKRPVAEIDYGFVGDLNVDTVNISFASLLINNSITPVIAPISYSNNGELLNVNADTVASAIAIALSKTFKTTLLFGFEKAGVLKQVNDNNSIIYEINTQNAEALKADGSISEGMLPKIDNAFNAINKGIQQVYIAHASFIKPIAENKKGYGTRITC